MTLYEQLEERLVDHLYEQVIKPLVTECNDEIKQFPPVRSGRLRDDTYVYLGRGSDATKAIVVMESDPPQTAPYNTFRKDFGQVDYANFTNKRGRTAGWWDDAVAAVARKFATG